MRKTMAHLELRCYSVGWLATNCYLIWDPASGEALVIDPGAESPELLRDLQVQQVHVRTIVNTHGHSDHIGGNAALKKRTGASLLVHAADQPLLGDPVANLSQGLGWSIISPPADGSLHEGKTLALGPLCFHVIETPGHTAGSICLAGEGLLFSGDTLFAGSVGRTDLPGGDSQQLQKSIFTKLFPLDPATLVYPGHGAATSLEREKLENPFLT